MLTYEIEEKKGKNTVAKGGSGGWVGGCDVKRGCNESKPVSSPAITYTYSHENQLHHLTSFNII